MQVTVFDKLSYKVDSKRVYTDEGFLRVPGRVARTGTQEYLACELGLDGNPNRIVKVLRSADEVFSPESLASYNGVDVTIEHPSQFVDAKTYNAISKGVVLDAERDGDFVLSNLIIKSKDAIEAVESGKVELSVGYSAEYVKLPEGSACEYEQKNIRANHVALVDRARAGARAKIFDNNNTPECAMIKVTLDSGRSIELEDNANNALIADSYESMSKKVADAEAKAEKAEAKADAMKEKKEKAEEELKKATDADVISERLKELSQVKDSALLIAGDDFKCDSVDSMDIKREALAKVRDGIDWSKKSDEYVNASFDITVSDAESKKDDEEDMDKNKDQRRKLAEDGASAPQQTIDSNARRRFYDANKYKLTTGELTQDQLNELADKAGQ